MRTLVFESSDHTTVAAEARKGWHCWSSHRTLRGSPSKRPLALGFAGTIPPSSPLPRVKLSFDAEPGVLQKNEFDRFLLHLFGLGEGLNSLSWEVGNGHGIARTHGDRGRSTRDRGSALEDGRGSRRELAREPDGASGGPLRRTAARERRRFARVRA